MLYLFDSNILIYYLANTLSPKGVILLEKSIYSNGCYSVITQIEVLGFAQSTAERDVAIDLFSGLKPIALNEGMTNIAIELRCKKKIKTPDAIIAATALSLGATLVTRNSKDFAWIDELKFINPFL